MALKARVKESCDYKTVFVAGKAFSKGDFQDADVDVTLYDIVKKSIFLDVQEVAEPKQVVEVKEEKKTSPAKTTEAKTTEAKAVETTQAKTVAEKMAEKEG